MSSPDQGQQPYQRQDDPDSQSATLGSGSPQQPAPWHFLVDESMSRDLTDALRADGYDTEDGRDVGLRSQPDSAVFAYAQAHQRTIITFDKGQGGINTYPAPHAGIIVARLPQQMATLMRVQLIMARLHGLAGTDFTDSVVVIDQRRVRVRHT